MKRLSKTIIVSLLPVLRSLRVAGCLCAFVLCLNLSADDVNSAKIPTIAIINKHKDKTIADRLFARISPDGKNQEVFNFHSEQGLFQPKEFIGAYKIDDQQYVIAASKHAIWMFKMPKNGTEH